MLYRFVLTIFSLFIFSYSFGQNFTVNSTIDAVDAVPGDGLCDDGSGNCTLRAAIQESNSLGGAHIITLPTGTVPLSIVGANEDACATGDLDITADITINGISPITTIVSADSLDRVFHITPTGLLTITNLTITKGYLIRDYGAGIFNENVLG